MFVFAIRCGLALIVIWLAIGLLSFSTKGHAQELSDSSELLFSYGGALGSQGFYIFYSLMMAIFGILVVLPRRMYKHVFDYVDQDQFPNSLVMPLIILFVVVLAVFFIAIPTNPAYRLYLDKELNTLIKESLSVVPFRAGLEELRFIDIDYLSYDDHFLYAEMKDGKAVELVNFSGSREDRVIENLISERSGLQVERLKPVE